MDTSQAFVFRRMVSPGTFKQLCCLWQQMAASVGEGALLWKDEVWCDENQDFGFKTARTQVRLLLSPQLSLLLLAQLVASSSLYQISLTWERDKIEGFLTKLKFESYRNKWHNLEQKQLTARPPAFNFELLNQFIFQLLDIITGEPQEILNWRDDCHSLCYPTHQYLYQQLEQERLLNQVIRHIRESLELPIILETAVEEVQKFLQVDRLLIYQFINKSCQENDSMGKITYEARVSPAVPSILELIPEDDCFSYLPHYQEKYRRGAIVAIDDVETAYSSSFCLCEFLRNNSVLSSLIAPIVVKNKLWGLLIAHQCFKKRKWQKNEQFFLGIIGEHLAIAIQQSQLLCEIKEQKESFEKRVIERTQELHDSLVAAQTANQYKNEFLDNMSHELLTPLTCIIGLSGTLLHWAGKETGLPVDKQIKYIKNILNNGKILLDLINDILDYSSVSAGHNELNIKDFSLYTISSTLIDYFQEEAAQKQIKLKLDFQIDKPRDKFCADLRRVQQILSQLIKNAIKFTDNSGQVVLRVWRENGDVFFQVEDTGIGISQEQLPLLFENFKQLEKPRNRTHGGTGLGLALTKQLIELHRGTIEVESIPEKGSVFTVRLPNQVKCPLQKRETGDNYEQQACGNRTIVIVSKDEEVSILICELLTVNNYQAIWLIDDYPPLKQIEVLHPKIVIVDEGKNSQVYSFTKQIKKLLAAESTKILILKKSLQSMNCSSLAENGIDDYLLEPIEPNHLLDKIQLWHSL